MKRFEDLTAAERARFTEELLEAGIGPEIVSLRVAGAVKKINDAADLREYASQHPLATAFTLGHNVDKRQKEQEAAQKKLEAERKAAENKYSKIAKKYGLE